MVAPMRTVPFATQFRMQEGGGNPEVIRRLGERVFTQTAGQG